MVQNALIFAGITNKFLNYNSNSLRDIEPERKTRISEIILGQLKIIVIISFAIGVM